MKNIKDCTLLEASVFGLKLGDFIVRNNQVYKVLEMSTGSIRAQKNHPDFLHVHQYFRFPFTIDTFIPETEEERTMLMLGAKID